MALTAVTGSRKQHWLDTRPGNIENVDDIYTCLVSDLLAGDFVCGIRATIITHDTAGTNRDELVERLGEQFTVSMVATSTVMIIRPA